MWDSPLEMVENYRNGQGHYPAAVIGGLAFYGKAGNSVRSPVDGEVLAVVGRAEEEHLTEAVNMAHECFLSWRRTPAPKRGDLVRVMGEIARENKEALARFITLEAGKTWQESLGEVQEMIDICDFACGLSRQLYGLTIATERPDHRRVL